MSDNFLTTVLEIVIVLDLLGVIAYFGLSLLRPRHRTATSSAPSGVAPNTLWRRRMPHGRFGQFTQILRHPLTFRRTRSTSPGPITRESLESAFGNLRRVLFSYEKGLA